MSSSEEFDVFITVTGFNHYPNAKRLFDGDEVTLCREIENEFDKSAISVYSEFGKIGYVANSDKTIRKGTISATQLATIMDSTATAKVIEGGYYEAICRVVDVFDVDKMILKASGFYNAGEYSQALPLFLRICEKYDSLLLMQYTADCLVKLGKYKESLNFSEKAIKLEENNKISLMMYATALHKLEKYNEAIEIYSKILAITENEKVRQALSECRQQLNNK